MSKKLAVSKLIFLALSFVVLLFPLSSALAQTYSFDSLIGADIESEITVAAELKQKSAGVVSVMLTLPPGAGTLVGAFFNVSDESILPSLQILDDSGHIKKSLVSANAVSSISRVNVTPVKKWDVGIRFKHNDRSGQHQLSKPFFSFSAPGLETSHFTNPNSANDGFLLAVVVNISVKQDYAKVGLPTDSLPIEAERVGSVIRYVNPNGLCGGKTPCYSSIQSAINTVSSGDTIRVQTGVYQEQLTIADKNRFPSASEAARITIERDPNDPVGSVVLDASNTVLSPNCQYSYGIDIKDSKYITIRGFSIINSNAAALQVNGKNHTNADIHIERNRIYGNGSSWCDGGILIKHGNRGTIVANNIISHNRGNGLTFMEHGHGGPTYIVGNTIYKNDYNGIRFNYGSEALIANNILYGNGLGPSAHDGWGIKRPLGNYSNGQKVRLLNNILCANRDGALNGQLIDDDDSEDDGLDSRNFTPNGNEGFDVYAIPNCAENIFTHVAGEDGAEGTADDDFSLLEGSPAIDAGVDPRTLEFPSYLHSRWVSDYLQEDIRPQGEGFEIGAIERSSVVIPPPTVAISSPSNGTLLNVTTVTVSGSVTDADTLSINGVNATIDGTTFFADILLTEGENLVTAIAENTTDSASDSITLHVDTASPSISISSPEDGLLTTEVEVTVSGSINESASLTSFTVNGSSVPLIDDAFSTTVSLALGTNVITIVARDTATNETTEEITVIRGEAPTLIFVAPAPGTLTQETTIEVRGTFTGTTPVIVRVNGVEALITDNTFSRTIDLVEGENVISVVAENEFGSASVSEIVIVDTIPPQITITTPEDGFLTAAPNVTVSGTVLDANLGSVVTINGISAPISGEVFTATVPLTLGANTIAVEITDLAGNVESASITVTKGELPTVTIENPTDGALLDSSEVTVTGTFTNALSVSINGINATLVGNTFTSTVTLPEGSHVITTWATNLFGSSSNTVNVTVEINEAPTITSSAPTSVNRGETYIYDVEASDADPGDSFTFSLDAPVPSGMTIDSASGLISWTPDFSVSGAFTVTVRVTDSGGLSDTETFSINVLSIPIAMFRPAQGINVASEISSARVISTTSENPSFPASNILYPNLTTDWRTATGDATNQSVTIELSHGESYVIDSVLIKTRTQGVKNFELRTSNTGTLPGDFNTLLTGIVPNNSPDGVSFSFPATSARYVKFVALDGYITSYITVNELRIFERSRQGGLISLFEGGASIVESSSTTVDNPDHAAIDIDSTTFWQTELGKGTNQWIKISPVGGTSYRISAIQVHNPGNTIGMMKDFEIRVSNTTLADADFRTVFAGTVPIFAGDYWFNFPEVEARYIQLFVTSTFSNGPFVKVFNFEVYSRDVGGNIVPLDNLSADPGGSIVSQIWDYDDGTTSPELNPIHTYASPGTYNINLTVTDDEGLTHSYTRSYTVVAPPVADFSWNPTAPLENENILLSDQSTVTTGSIVKWEWTLPDGSTATEPVALISGLQDSGNFDVTLRVTNDQFISSTITKTITVGNVAPIAYAGSSKTVVWGESWNASAWVSDASVLDSGSLSCRWVFGDGITQDVANCSLGSAVNVEHIYNNVGNVTAALTVTDKDGGVATSSTDVSVTRRDTFVVVYKALSATADGQVEVLARLADSYEPTRPIASRSVTFSKGTESITVVTDANGDARATLQLESGVPNTITVEFAGDSLYEDSIGSGTFNAADFPEVPGIGSGLVLDEKGKEFVFSFLQNSNTGRETLLLLELTSDIETIATVEIPGIGFGPTSYAVVPHQATLVELPLEAQMTISGLIWEKGGLVTSLHPIRVQGINKQVASTDGFLAIPNQSLGKEHYIASFSSRTGDPSLIGIVATEDNTTVTITPTVNVQSGQLAGIPFNVTLNKYQSYQIEVARGITEDFSGSKVVADKPIAVYGGHTCAFVPDSTNFCDHLVEQIPSTSTWGTHFLTVPLSERLSGDLFRIVAASDNTEITIDGVPSATIHSGEYYEVDIPSNQYSVIETSQPVLTTQYAKGTRSDDLLYDFADPFMMLVVPTQQFGRNYTVSTIPDQDTQIYPFEDYVNLVARSSKIGGIRIDGFPISSSWAPIGTSGYSGAQVFLPKGTHKITHVSPAEFFGVYVYGFATTESYGYPAGQRFSSLGDTCVPSSQIAGDLIDNDCDFQTDEELGNGIDDDGDGFVDEDLASGQIGINVAPEAHNQGLSLVQGTTSAFLLSGFDANGDDLTFEIVTPPTSGALSGSGFSYSYSPNSSFVGSDSLTFRVFDGRDYSNEATVSIVVKDPLDLTNIAPQAFGKAITLYENTSWTFTPEVFDADGDALTYQIVNSPLNGVVTGSGPEFIYTPDPDYVGTDSLVFRVNDGFVDSNAAPVDFTIENLPVPDNRAPQALSQTVELEKNTPETFLLAAYDPDGDSLTYEIVDLATNGTLSQNGQEITYTPNSDFSGEDSFTFRVSDGEFVSDKVTVTLFVTLPVDPRDTLAPAISITSPPSDQVVTMFADVVGTVNDENLVSWTIKVVNLSSGAVRLVASGNAPVLNGLLGRIDATVLINGTYELQIEAEDSNGRISVTSVPVRIDGQAKIGLFSISFVDLQIPVSGIPITVLRNYDSRRKTHEDFGIGWTLQVKQGSLEHNRPSGQGWTIEQGDTGFRLPCTKITEIKYHTTEVRISDAEYYLFQPKLASVASVAGGCTGRFIYEQIDSSVPGATLGILNGEHFVYQDGTQNILNPETFEPWIAEDVRLTTADGRVFEVNLYDGITLLQDNNGNNLTFTEDGIFHSDGKDVLFRRDGFGRIEKLIAPDGTQITYSYDDLGDLSAITNQLGETTSFVYHSGHYLSDIIDPRGEIPVRLFYDTEGRLIKSIDAFGNESLFEHDLDTRTEITTDRRGYVTVHSYDDRGNVLKVTDPLGGISERTYDAQDNEETFTDENGNTTTRTYDESNNVRTVTDPLGRVTTYTYNTQNSPLTITDPKGNVTKVTYYPSGNLETITDAAGNVTRSEYDAKGRLKRSTDSLENFMELTYDAFGNVETETDKEGFVTTFTYDDNGNLRTETSLRTTTAGPVTATETKVYDLLNRLAEEIDANGVSELTTYNLIGKVKTTTDRNGNPTRFFYDAAGLLERQEFADGTETKLFYDAEGNKTREVDQLGQETISAYDPLNRLFKITAPDGGVSISVFDPAGRLFKEIDAYGNVTTHGYNNAGELLDTTDALGHVTSFTYDDAGNRTSATDARSNTTIFKFDELNREFKTTFPDGTFIQKTFDVLGRVRVQTDRGGLSTAFDYDAEGRLRRVTDALGGETTYTYNELGNKLTQTDAEGRTTTWTHDILGRAETRTLSLGQVETFAYDNNGNVFTRSDFNGKLTTHDYDELNRIKRKRFADGSEYGFTYTATGKVESETNYRGTTTYSYNSKDRLSSQENPDGSFLIYGYDLNDNRTFVETPSGITIHTYDELDRLRTVTDPTGGVTTYSYDEVGNQAQIEQTNGTITTNSYDTLNRLDFVATTDSVGNLLTSFDYVLDPVGNREKVTEASGRVVDYRYDLLYRLESEAVTDPVNGNVLFEYTYDGVGNRFTKFIDGLLIENYVYDDNDRLTSSTSTSYTYDDNGNTLTETTIAGGASYTYDLDDRVRKTTTLTNVVDYTYDTDGVRQSKTVDGVLTAYLVDRNRPYAQVVEELDSAGAVRVEYTYGDDLLSQNSATTGQFFYHYDGLGSTRGLTDSAETLTDSYDYEAFGEVLNSSGSTPNSYLFTGEQLDPVLNQYYSRARYYNQAAGRFTQQDEWMGSENYPITLNKYLYANANPVLYIDPSGKYTIVQVGAAIGTVAGLASSAYSIYSGISLFNEGDKLIGSAEIALGFMGVGAVAGSVRVLKFVVSPVNHAIRLSYLSKLRQLSITINKLQSAGRTPEQIARTVVKMRNSIKATQHLRMIRDGGIAGKVVVEVLEARNLIRYRGRFGPSAKWLFRKKGSWGKVVEGASRSSDAVNKVMGIGTL